MRARKITGDAGPGAENAAKLDWTAYTPPRPSSLETIALPQYDVAELVARIDWTPFFRTWELAGSIPKFWRMISLGSALIFVQ